MRMLDRLGVGLVALMVSLAACGGDEDGATNPTGGGGMGGTSGTGGAGGLPDVQDIQVSGTVVDFGTGAPVAGSATLSTVGLTPPPTVSVTGADFTITAVPPHSVFHLLAGAPPEYRSTYSRAVEVTTADVSGVQAQVVSEAWLADAQTAFGVSPAAGTGIVIARAVDQAGAPRAGIPASAFLLNNGAPPAPARFLADDLSAAPAETQTGASGYLVFYDVPAGLVAFAAAMNSGFTIAGAASPAAANTVTLIELTVTDGGPVLPVGVSFSNDVMPIFESRGCVFCHSSNNPGNDLGNLSVNGGANAVHRELTEEVSPTYSKTRVDFDMPEQSLILTMPSVEPVPDAHPNITFASAADPDYLTILAWITEGAMQN